MTRTPPHKAVRTAGTACIWPRGLRDRYGISGPTLWRWERSGKLPARDVFVGGRAIGWRPQTIERAERGEIHAANDRNLDDSQTVKANGRTKS